MTYKYISTSKTSNGVTVLDSNGAYSVNASNVLNSIDIEKLWEKMYTKAKNMWFSCPYCKSANALGNSNCVSCGAPLGDKK